MQRSRGILTSALTAFFCALMMLPLSTSMAAASMQNDNHTDTGDYCMRAQDVSISMSEIDGIEDALWKAAILEQAAPAFLIRDKSVHSSKWVKVADGYTVDWSAVQPIIDSDGYAVFITLPEITAGLVSRIEFKVYVTPDAEPTPAPAATPTDMPTPDPTTTPEPTAILPPTVSPGPMPPADPAIMPTEAPIPGIIVTAPELTPAPTASPAPTKTPSIPRTSAPTAAPLIEAAKSFEPIAADKGFASPLTGQDGETDQAYQAQAENGVTAATSAKEERPNMLLICTLAVLNMVTAPTFAYSIASDIYVLEWYARKKAERRSK